MFVRRWLLRAARAAGCRCGAPRWRPRGVVAGLATGLVVVGVWSKVKKLNEISEILHISVGSKIFLIPKF